MMMAKTNVRARMRTRRTAGMVRRVEGAIWQLGSHVLSWIGTAISSKDRSKILFVDSELRPRNQIVVVKERREGQEYWNG